MTVNCGVAGVMWTESGLFGKAGLLEAAGLQRTSSEDLPYSEAIALCYMPGGGSLAAGAGIGAAWEPALLAATGEAIERQCLRVSPQLERSARWAPASELKGRVLAPGSWPMFTDAQHARPDFPYPPFDDSPRYWVEATSLADRSAIWVPATLVWLGTPAAGDHLLTSGISTGSASHVERDRALLSGLYESVERDALAIVWESRAVTGLLDPRAPWQDPELRRLDDYADARGLRLLLREITTDLGLPTVLAVLRDPRRRRPAMTIGSATRACVRDASLRAAMECVHCWGWVRDEHRKRVDESYEQAYAAASKPTEMLAHAFLYGFPEAEEHARHLWSDAEFEDTPVGPLAHERPLSPEAELAIAVERLVGQGYEPLSVDIATPDVAALGFHVYKTLVPATVPLSVGSWCRHLGNPRIKMVPAARGWKHPGPLPVDAGVPHPLP